MAKLTDDVSLVIIVQNVIYYFDEKKGKKRPGNGLELFTVHFDECVGQKSHLRFWQVDDWRVNEKVDLRPERVSRKTNYSFQMIEKEKKEERSNHATPKVKNVMTVVGANGSLVRKQD